MAGTLTISTLSDGTNSTSATNCIQGSAKAWVNFNGSTATIRTSYNVSSVTRTTTGQYVVNFTNAMTDANYAFFGTSNDDTSAPVVVSALNAMTKTTTQMSFYTARSTTGVTNDTLQANIAIFR